VRVLRFRRDPRARESIHRRRRGPVRWLGDVLVVVVVAACLQLVIAGTQISPNDTLNSGGLPLRTAQGLYPDTWDGIHLGITIGDIATGITSAMPGTHLGYVWAAPTPGTRGSPLLEGAHLDHYLAPVWNDVAPTAQPKHDLGWFQRNHPDWIAYRCDSRGRPTLTPAWYGFGTAQQLDRVPLDWSNPDVQQYLLENARQALRIGFDGIAVDNVGFTNFQAVCGTYAWTMIGGHRSLAWKSLGYPAANTTNSKLVRDLLGFFRLLSRELSREFPDKTITANASALQVGLPLKEFAPYFNGVLDEQGFMGPHQRRITGADWLAQVQQAEGLANLGKAYISVAYANPGQAGLPPPGPDRDSLVNWVLANYLLVKCHQCYTYVHRLGPRFVDLPEYHVPIGSPTGPRMARDGAQVRTYSGGMVLVNPSPSEAVTVGLDDPMQDSAGRLMSTVRLPPASGLVLLRPPAPAQ
jgi:hypothetical protein